ncbi:helix-turn-helix domain-containing protein [Paraburkholderia sp. CNPSo 3157]|uniref:Helix-turn-helix domain-containing protein n=1 Tax=Paraburkholderia franconis TaxID=2654983 RepID=A0A7X1N696_9BURK|nr:helix-turn-helix domain-containing protein [Paraburkholderia franconis]
MTVEVALTASTEEQCRIGSGRARAQVCEHGHDRREAAAARDADDGTAIVAEAERAGPGQPLALRQGDIAEALNVTREAVSTALRRFRQAGLIETRYRAIGVIDLETPRSGDITGLSPQHMLSASTEVL